MASHTHKHATSRLGKVTQIWVTHDDGFSSVSIVPGHVTGRKVGAEVDGIINRRKLAQLGGIL